MRWIRSSPALCEVCGNARLNGFRRGVASASAAANPLTRRVGGSRREGRAESSKVRYGGGLGLPLCRTSEEMCVLVALHASISWRVHKGCVRSVVSRCATGAPSDSDPSPFACPSRHVYTHSLCSRWRNTWAPLYPGWLPSLLCDGTHTHTHTGWSVASSCYRLKQEAAADILSSSSQERRHPG